MGSGYEASLSIAVRLKMIQYDSIRSQSSNGDVPKTIQSRMNQLFCMQFGFCIAAQRDSTKKFWGSDIHIHLGHPQRCASNQEQPAFSLEISFPTMLNTKPTRQAKRRSSTHGLGTVNARCCPRKGSPAWRKTRKTVWTQWKGLGSRVVTACHVKTLHVPQCCLMFKVCVKVP